jgi:hypothetical protein
MVKKEKVLNPIIEEKKDFNMPNIDKLKSILTNENDIITTDKNTSDNFFRAVIDKMFNSDDIELKTEYVSLNENFSGAKLEFLAKYGNMPYLHDFLNILERKRVSLGRKSRIELIKVFEKRDEEINAQNRLQNVKELLGI